MKVDQDVNLMILGGYGAAGRAIAQTLLEHTQANITIAGRNQQKSKDLVASLSNLFPSRNIRATHADANNKISLVSALEDVDLVIVATTTPGTIGVVAEAALETETDMLDIFVRADVVDALEVYRGKIVAHNRRFITQAGFHPGLIAPIIRYAAPHFDSYIEANIFMAMALIVETPESLHEIIYEAMEGNSQTLKEGEWVKASYKDAVSHQFTENFGTKNCYPLDMKEMHALNEELGLRTAGAYAAGFNFFIDMFVFSLAIIIGVFSKKLSQRVCGKLMFWSAKKNPDRQPRVELKLEAKGTKDNKDAECHIFVSSDDGYELTAQAVVACLNQYLDNTISEPGLYLMGDVVDEKRIIRDLIEMGVHIDEELN